MREDDLIQAVRVDRLIPQRRQPGRIQGGGAPGGRKPAHEHPAFPAGDPDAVGREDEETQVVRGGRQGGERGVDEPPPRAFPGDGFGQRQRAGQDEHSQQRVHPGLLARHDLERRDADQEGAEEAHRLGGDAPQRGVGQGDAQETEAGRGDADRGFSRARHPDPGLHHQVIQRGMEIDGPHEAQEIVPLEPREPDHEHLIRPQARLAQARKPQSGRKGDNPAEGRSCAHPRWGPQAARARFTGPRRRAHPRGGCVRDVLAHADGTLRLRPRSVGPRDDVRRAPGTSRAAPAGRGPLGEAIPHLTDSARLKIGRYREISMAPMTMPMPTIRIGSRIEVRLATVLSISAS